ncbi:bZIP transcription factor [Aspergillus clavatus NRRL 1]|uniref:BZIP transcription factor, putative n=1 Tax=Aspergillus clavatus (strain ATCC 1007 / CBS 513.65 / DSM 816 / NCTC 3887 / NRRL 1 / QM 1276 / 107) TaxID=344612 RepID=A1CN98_ASPCL|nr:bZIP transcription factor, putative [Aspergillus clavatus NRRL 1]EAW07119.1 bZIP transcription factor, putative [Aspergillus clavatus NRRL 1]
MAQRPQLDTGAVPYPSPYMSVPMDYGYALGYHNTMAPMRGNHGLSLSAASSVSGVDIESHPSQEGSFEQSLVDTMGHYDSKTKNVKRRMQNREAQRRFRERKDQQQKTLQAKAEDLQTKYQKLSDQYTQRTDEVCRLLKENDSLRSEVKTLRQQWQIIMALMHRPRSSHSRTPSLAEEDSPPPSLCSLDKGTMLDDVWRRLDEFRSTDDKPSSPS